MICNIHIFYRIYHVFVYTGNLNVWYGSSAIVVGVATFCKASATPVEAEEGLYKELNPKLEGKVGHYGDVSEFSSDELEALDAEGRAVITKHKIR